MGRKTQVTKEQMLEAGLQIVLRDGHEKLGIKTIAAEIGCSTHPIPQSFGNMENYRRELLDYAMEYLNRKIVPEESHSLEFRRAGEAYIETALKEPKLLLFLRTDMKRMKEFGGIGMIFAPKWRERIIEDLMSEFDLTKQKAEDEMQLAWLYTEGIVAMLLAGVLECTRDEAVGLLDKIDWRGSISVS